MTSSHDSSIPNSNRHNADSQGQLGLSDTESRANPTLLEALSGCHIVTLGAGTHHTLAVSARAGASVSGAAGGAGPGEVAAGGGNGGGKGNTVWSWGCNEFGQLGIGLDLDSAPPGPSFEGGSLGGPYVGSAHCQQPPTPPTPPTPWMATAPQRVRELSGSGVLTVAAGERHSLALLACDEVRALPRRRYRRRRPSSCTAFSTCVVHSCTSLCRPAPCGKVSVDTPPPLLSTPRRLALLWRAMPGVGLGCQRRGAAVQ